MKININMPACYIQEKGAISKIAIYFKNLVKDNVLILMDEFTYSNFKDKVSISFEEENIKYIIEPFKGECCMENINIFIDKANKYNIKTVIGIGGGKALDVAKAVGYFGDMKTIMVPTAASTDGPCSKISVLYESDGTFKEYINLNNNPDGVVVDTEVIANAPVRLLKAGIGDGLSTYFETEAGYDGDIEKQGFSNISITARSLSKECFNTLITYGCEAVDAVENKVVNKALEKVVEAIIYLSCVGFENGSLAAAHSVANGLTSTPKYNSFMHGEKVAFGTIVQMLLENKSVEVINKVRDLCKKLGLPYSMNNFQMENDELDNIVKNICKENQPINNMKSNLNDFNKVKAAIIRTNEL